MQKLEVQICKEIITYLSHSFSLYQSLIHSVGIYLLITTCQLWAKLQRFKDKCEKKGSPVATWRINWFQFLSIVWNICYFHIHRNNLRIYTGTSSPASLPVLFSSFNLSTVFTHLIPWVTLFSPPATVVSNSVQPHRRQPTRLPHPWDSPGKNTGVDCHFLLQCMKVKSVNEVTQSCPTLSDPMDCSLPGSSVHGIFQARVLEWVPIAWEKFTIAPKNLTNQISIPNHKPWKFPSVICLTCLQLYCKPVEGVLSFPSQKRWKHIHLSLSLFTAEILTNQTLFLKVWVIPSKILIRNLHRESMCPAS